MQTISLEHLRTCKAAVLSDFVLEVVRTSAVQALSARDRRCLVGETTPSMSRSTGVSSSSYGPQGQPLNSHSKSHGSQAPAGFRNLHVDVGCSGMGLSSPAASRPRGADGPTVTPADWAAALQGTPGAQRAVSGLTQWVLRVTACTAGQMPPGCAGPLSCSANASHESHTAPLSAAAAAAAGAAMVAAAHGGLERLPAAQGRGLALAAEGAAASSDEAPDLLGLMEWEALAAVLEHAQGSADPLASLAQRSEPSGLRSEQALCGPVGRVVGGSGAAASEPATAPAHLPAAGTSWPVAGNEAVAVSDEQRWTLAAETLSRCLSCCSRGVGGGGLETAAEGAVVAVAARLPPVLPRLRPEHLRCRHPGLRAVLLTYALLTHCHARDKAAAAAAAAASAAKAAMEPGGTSGEDLGVPVREADAGAGASLPSSAELIAHGNGGTCAVLCSRDPGMAAAAAVAMAAAITPPQLAARPPPASPAPPLPPLRHMQSGPVLRDARSAGGGGGSSRLELDMLAEHNRLVQMEHEVREQRRQEQAALRACTSVGGHGAEVSSMLRAGGGVAAEELPTLWAGEGDDDETHDQEERVMRLWLNSLDPAIHVTSLFEQAVSTGWPLLQALDAIQPGCVPWADAFRPPFKEVVRKILSVQNCNLVIEVCTRQLAMPPLVNIGGVDIALGHRRATLSLVFQMMRHHMGMLLGLAAAPGSPGSPCGAAASPTAAGRQAANPGAAALDNGPALSTASHLQAQLQQHPCHTPPPHHQPPPQPPNTPGHPQRVHGRAHVELEKAVLAWANAKLAEASVAAASGAAGGVGALAPPVGFPPLASFSDPRLGQGQVLLQVLAAICPHSVNPKHVMPGHTEEERGSNARYLLSCARKMGCAIFLAWEDVVAARPRLLLPLLAAFMALDRKRSEAAVVAAAPATAVQPPLQPGP